MPRQRKNGRLYWKQGRAYGDFRSLGGKLEALIPPGERRATMDPDVAAVLAAERVKKLEGIRRGLQIVGIGEAAALGPFAQHHLEAKKALNEATDWTLGMVERMLARAVDYFGSNTALTAIDVQKVQGWSTWLRKFSGRRGRGTLSDGAVRHHLNSLSNLFRRAQTERMVPPGYNPVAAWDRKPKGKPQEAKWLEVHEAALFLEACTMYEQKEGYEAIPDLHALVATMLLTGGRPGEVRGLARGDVSFSRKTITFREHSWRRLKTDGSRRAVPLWPQLEAILREYLAGPNAPADEMLFPSLHRRVRGQEGETMLGDVRGALDAVAEKAGWKAGEIRSYIFRHTYCSARMQTLDQGAPVSPLVVGRELGHGGDALVKKVYAHLGTVRHRSEVVEYLPKVLGEIPDKVERRAFRERLAAVRKLKIA